jgi:hypothetical protein
MHLVSISKADIDYLLISGAWMISVFSTITLSVILMPFVLEPAA